MIPAVVECCAGIDVSKKEVTVTVLKGPLDQEPTRETKTFYTLRADLDALRTWLIGEGVSCAVMESTGIYWQPIKNVLEDAVAIVLANAEDVKARAGHKTDPKIAGGWPICSGTAWCAEVFCRRAQWSSFAI